MMRPSPQTVRRWRAFQRQIERSGADEYETLLPYRSPMDLRFGGSAPAKLFYCTKRIFVDTLDERNLIPKDWLVISRFLMPTGEAISAIRHLMRGFRLPLTFVGDLDPLDLTIFAALRAGSPDFSVPARPLSVGYAGVDDVWLALTERFRTRPSPVNDQSDLEREHLAILFELIPDLEMIVGSRCLNLLKAGKKLELEGAYNPGGYRAEYAGQLTRHLSTRARKLVRGSPTQSRE